MPISERFQGANTVDAGRRSPYWGEHAARYRFALPFVTECRVLDIACGTGYGLSLLGTAATQVVGADIDIEAAKQASAECGNNGSVLLADGLTLPFESESFDVITSFETLEHLHKRPEFLRDLLRVLRRDGMLILSTPNARYSQPVDGKPTNPFHVHEYEPGELLAELEPFCSVERFVGQTLAPDSGIPPFYDAQQRLPKDVSTQLRLNAWKAINKIPFALRERLSEAIWQKPFYPTEGDYVFSEQTVESAPTLVAVCRKK